MESARILTPPSTGLSGILLQNPIFLKDQNMKNYQHFIYVRGDVLPTPRGTMTAVAKGIVKEYLFVRLMLSHSHRVTFGHIEFHLPYGFPLS